MVVLGILAFILILGIIVLIHEGGHFFFAKRAGILCYEFSIGMGPLIYQKKIGETYYSLRAIPIGGYVSMAGEEIESNPLKDVNYCDLKIENGKVVEIICLKEDATEFENKYKIVSSDLIGTKEELEGELFIEIEDNENVVHYEVARDCIVRFSKKEAIQIAPYNRLFVNKTILQRFLAVFAGPFMNMVLAFVVFFIMGIVTGYANYDSTQIYDLEPNTPAYEAGLRDGDTILYIGNESVTAEQYFSNWNDISEALDEYAKGNDFNGSVRVVYKNSNGEILETIIKPNVIIQTIGVIFINDGSNSLEVVAPDAGLSKDAGIQTGDVIKSINGVNFTTRSEVLAFFQTGDGALTKDFEVTVLRNGEEVKLEKIESYKKQTFEDNNIEVTKVQLYISPAMTRNIGRLLIEPFKQIGTSATVILKTLGALFTKDSGISVTDLSGPVGIAQATVSMLEQGALSLMNWMAILSVNIGLMNILPLPALDGGRLAFILYEAITRKKANPKVENIIHSIGFILLMILFVFVAFNDVLRIFK